MSVFFKLDLTDEQSAKIDTKKILDIIDKYCGAMAADFDRYNCNVVSFVIAYGINIGDVVVPASSIYNNGVSREEALSIAAHSIHEHHLKLTDKTH